MWCLVLESAWVDVEEGKVSCSCDSRLLGLLLMVVLLLIPLRRAACSGLTFFLFWYIFENWVIGNFNCLVGNVMTMRLLQ